MLVTIGYWAASAIFLASMGKADFSLVNKTTYTDADGEVQTVVEQLEDTVPCDVNVSMRRSVSISAKYTNALNYVYRISCVGERHIRTSVQLPQLRWRRVSSKILLHSFSNIITQNKLLLLLQVHHLPAGLPGLHAALDPQLARRSHLHDDGRCVRLVLLGVPQAGRHSSLPRAQRVRALDIVSSRALVHVHVQ